MLAIVAASAIGLCVMPLIITQLTPQLDPLTPQRLKKAESQLNEMLGEPASTFHNGQWVGGAKPTIADKPYLLFFWSTWCSACDPYLLELNDLHDEGVVVIGMHPAGIKARDVDLAIQSMQLHFPTFVSTDERGVMAPIADYQVAFFPYSILVNSEGVVVSHGYGIKKSKAQLDVLLTQASELE
ncbi:TlpA family protein disulfide reductase [Novipirellula sp. SH528]|uniref:TlpA family protein disulfide reductase n=1 Tax=Novipirellula sp. SH528 TaxID=3454466 RepID=UPI003FA03162